MDPHTRTRNGACTGSRKVGQGLVATTTAQDPLGSLSDRWEPVAGPPQVNEAVAHLKRPSIFKSILALTGSEKG